MFICSKWVKLQSCVTAFSKSCVAHQSHLLTENRTNLCRVEVKHSNVASNFYFHYLIFDIYLLYGVHEPFFALIIVYSFTAIFPSRLFLNSS